MKSLFFYGWIIVAVSFLNYGIGYGTRGSFSVFYGAILNDFNWDRASLAGAYSINMILFAVASPFAGFLTDRFGTRKIIPLGAFFLSLGLGLSAFITKLWHLYFLFGIFVSLGLCFIGLVPNSTVLSKWFSLKRGTALGIAFAGSGVGISILVPFIQFLISAFNWRTAFIILAGIISLVIIPINAILQRARPEDMGFSPDGIDRPSLSGFKDTLYYDLTVLNREWALKEWTVFGAMKTYQFWLLVILRVLSSNGINMILIHQVIHLVDMGYSELLSASIFGLSGMISIFGIVSLSYMSDRIGRELSLTISWLCSITGILFLLLIKDTSLTWMVYAFAFFFGMGLGSRGSLVSALSADLFQGKNFGRIYGYLTLGTGIGGGIGPWLGGFIYDKKGSYDLAFLIAIIGIAISIICTWVVGSRKIRTVGGKVKASQKYS